ncbi:MAG TPA: DUF2227 family putative metal-binding protein [Chlamydiales bacterium]|nr:DUF2227 family putative metal-binding protein [Chlamydiales bacterium]
MPSYRKHKQINLFLLPLFLSLAGGMKIPLSFLGLFSLAYLYSTFYMNPDMDVCNQIKLFSFRGLMTFPFRFYALFTKHRGLSHSFFLGTILRCLYLIGFIILILSLSQYIQIHSWNFSFLIKYRPELVTIFIGFLIADLVHILSDKTKKAIR